jgi:hypothetical protein
LLLLLLLLLLWWRTVVHLLLVLLRRHLLTRLSVKLLLLALWRVKLLLLAVLGREHLRWGAGLGRELLVLLLLLLLWGVTARVDVSLWGWRLCELLSPALIGFGDGRGVSDAVASGSRAVGTVATGRPGEIASVLHQALPGRGAQLAHSAVGCASALRDKGRGDRHVRHGRARRARRHWSLGEGGVLAVWNGSLLHHGGLLLGHLIGILLR